MNTEGVDFARSEDDVADLLKQIRAMGKGTQYYVPRVARPERRLTSAACAAPSSSPFLSP